MKNTNTKYVARRERRSDLTVGRMPLGYGTYLNAFRRALFLTRLLMTRGTQTTVTRTLTVLAITAVVLSVSVLPTFASQQPDSTQPPSTQDVQSAQQTPDQLQQLVAPFALYPDALVAQILAASTYPTQIVEADRWVQQHSKLEGDELASEADKESWDPSVKALTQFPSVLARMDKNLAWTSAVGDAYFNQEQDVLDAVQVMRKRAEDAGTLQSTPQQTVATQGSTIVIDPVDPDVCYLPEYDPWTVYGAPLAVYPGFFFSPWVGPSFFFGPRIRLGYFRRYPWGWPAWGFNWGRRQVLFNHNIYVSSSPSFFHRSPRDRALFRPGSASFPRGDNDGRGSDHGRGFDHNQGRGFGDQGHGRDRGDDSRNHGFEQPGGGSPRMPDNDHHHRANRGFDGSAPGTRSGVFSGIGPGGIERGSATRGQSSLGGGRGGFGGGGVRGGGFGGGGMRGGGGGGGMRGGGGGGRHR